MAKFKDTNLIRSLIRYLKYIKNNVFTSTFDTCSISSFLIQIKYIFVKYSKLRANYGYRPGKLWVPKALPRFTISNYVKIIHL